MDRHTLIQKYRQHSASTSDAVLSMPAKERVKNAVFSEIRNAQVAPATSRRKFSWSVTLVRFSMVVVLLLVVLTGTAYASSSSLPGDFLYPIKRAVENTQLAFTGSVESKAKLQVAFTEKRLVELEAIELKTAVHAELRGPASTALELPVASSSIAADSSAIVGQKTKIASPTPTVVKPTGTPTPTPKATTTTEQEKAREEVTKSISELEKSQQSLIRQGKVREAAKVAEAVAQLKLRISVWARVQGEQDIRREDRNDAEDKQNKESSKRRLWPRRVNNNSK